MADFYFVCGMPYLRPTSEDRRHREFDLVRPKDGQLPYVARSVDSALHLFRLCQHHSHLYQVLVSGDTKRLQTGEGNSPEELGPERFQMPEHLLKEIIGREDWYTKR